jgi:hypothetical protein
VPYIAFRADSQRSPQFIGFPSPAENSQPDAFRPEIESLPANGSTQKFIAGRYKMTQANPHNWLKKHRLN